MVPDQQIRPASAPHLDRMPRFPAKVIPVNPQTDGLEKSAVPVVWIVSRLQSPAGRSAETFGGQLVLGLLRPRNPTVADQETSLEWAAETQENRLVLAVSVCLS